MAKHIKVPATFDEQVNLLKSHGCIVDDKIFCREKLRSINYYRLSVYFLLKREHLFCRCIEFINLTANYTAFYSCGVFNTPTLASEVLFVRA